VFEAMRQGGEGVGVGDGGGRIRGWGWERGGAGRERPGRAVVFGVGFVR
jgi:hypothetical protein